MNGLYDENNYNFADGHSLSRLLSNYCTKYRPFEGSQRYLPIRCMAGSKSTLSSSKLYSNSPDSSRISLTSSLNNTYPRISASTGSSGIAHQQSMIHARNPSNALCTRRSEPFDMDDNRFKLHDWNPSITLSTRSAPLAAESSINTSAIFPLSFGSHNKIPHGNHVTTSSCDKSPYFQFSRPSERGVQTVSSRSSGLENNSRLDVTTTNSSHKIASTITTDRPYTVNPFTTHYSAYHFTLNSMFHQIARIYNHLYLSSLSALTPERLMQHGITLLVSATVDAAPHNLRSAVPTTLHVAVEDVEDANIQTHFDRVADRIASEHRRGGRTLVHCMAGVSRSSSLILAYLVRHMNMSLADAYDHVKKIRPCIQPNPGFWRQLLEYEERIRGSRSVRVILSTNYTGTGGDMGSSGRVLHTSGHNPSRISHTNLSTDSASDLLFYRPATSSYSLDTSNLLIRCRQPLNSERGE